MKKAFVKIEVAEDGNSININAKVDGNDSLVMIGLVETLTAEFVKLTSTNMAALSTAQLCDLIQRKIAEKSAENKASGGVWQ